MNTNMTNIFCTDCHMDATMHADGTVACGCSFVADPDTDTIPVAWDTTREAVYALQLAESDTEFTARNLQHGISVERVARAEERR